MEDIVVGHGRVIRVEFDKVGRTVKEDDEDEDFSFKRPVKLREITSLTAPEKIISSMNLSGTGIVYNKLRECFQFNRKLEFGEEYEIILRKKSPVKTEGRKFREENE